MKNKKANKAPVMILYMVKLDFKDMPIDGKIIRSGRILKRMTGNSYFPDPVPSLSEVSTALADVKLAQSRLDGTKILYIQRDIAMEKLENLIRQLRAYVENIANGDKVIILSSGFELCNRSTKGKQFDVTFFKRSNKIALEGQVNLRWNPLKGARQYVIQMCEDIDNPQWVNIAFSTKATVNINNLISGKKYYFRVAGMNSAGAGVFSPPVPYRAA